MLTERRWSFFTQDCRNTDILKIENRLDSRVIPDNSRAADEDVAYVEELLRSMESVLART